MFKLFGDFLVDISDTLLEMSGVKDLASTYSRRRAGVEPPAVNEAPAWEQEEEELRQTSKLNFKQQFIKRIYQVVDAQNRSCVRSELRNLGIN